MPVYFSRGLIADDGTILNAPAADGTSGQALTTDGSGALSFASVGGGSSDITGATASAPSPAADGDSDTGLFSDTDDTLSLAAGGVEALRIEEVAGEADVIFGDDSGFDFHDRATEPTSKVVGIASDAAGNGLQINMSVVGTSSSVPFGVYDHAGARIFEVKKDSVTFNVDSISIAEILVGDAVNVGSKSAKSYVTDSGGTGDLLELIHRTDASPTGRSVLFSVETDSSVNGKSAADISARWADATDATRKGRLLFNVYDTSAREAMRIEASGTAAMIGFLGETAVAQQATTGTTTGFTAGSGTGVNDDSTFTGGSGTAAYTIGDIVLALKNYGLLAAS